MPRDHRPRVLQIGFGAFGATHLAAWTALGLADRVTVADPAPAARAAAAAQAPLARVVAHWEEALIGADVVDIVAPTDLHHPIAAAAIAAGKDVFVEKPMTATVAEARDLERLAAAAGAVVQGGFYFRSHPKTVALRAWIVEGRLGRLRTLAGRFAGYKRSRADSGALLNDAVHFIDLFAWLAGGVPDTVYAVTRDHFGRGREDFAHLVLTFPGGPVATIETGYVQPGRWPDAVVAGAMTSKEIVVAGSDGAVEVDFAAETVTVHRLRHERRGGEWHPVLAPVERPEVAAAGPVAVVTAELAGFLDCVRRRAVPEADLARAGVAVARIVEAAARSAATRRVETLD